jgi:hypothetical protein
MNSTYLDETFNIYFRAVSKNAETKFESALWSAWGSAAYIINNGLSAMPGFDTIPDSLDKAKCLFNLCVQPMITFWFEGWERQEPHPSEEMLEAREVDFVNTQTFLGIQSQDIVTVHFILDAELLCVLNHTRNTPLYYMEMFHQRYQECVTKGNIVEWNKLKVPIKSWAEFESHCDKDRYTNLDPEYLIATWTLVANAGVFMFQEFKQIYEHK